MKNSEVMINSLKSSNGCSRMASVVSRKGISGDLWENVLTAPSNNWPKIQLGLHFYWKIVIIGLNFLFTTPFIHYGSEIIKLCYINKES